MVADPLSTFNWSPRIPNLALLASWSFFISSIAQACCAAWTLGKLLILSSSLLLFPQGLAPSSRLSLAGYRHQKSQTSLCSLSGLFYASIAQGF